MPLVDGGYRDYVWRYRYTAANKHEFLSSLIATNKPSLLNYESYPHLSPTPISSYTVIYIARLHNNQITIYIYIHRDHEQSSELQC